MITCTSNIDVVPDCSPGNDRPIGINNMPCAGDGFASSTFRQWCDLTAVLTREGIERALSSTSQVGGIGPGVIAIPLVEPGGISPVKGGLDGSYMAFERLS